MTERINKNYQHIDTGCSGTQKHTNNSPYETSSNDAN